MKHITIILSILLLASLSNNLHAQPTKDKNHKAARSVKQVAQSLKYMFKDDKAHMSLYLYASKPKWC